MNIPKNDEVLRGNPLFYESFIKNGFKEKNVKEVIKLIEKQYKEEKREIVEIGKIKLKREIGIEKIEVMMMIKGGKQEAVELCSGDIIWVECWIDKTIRFYLESTGGLFWNSGDYKFDFPEGWGYEKISCYVSLKDNTLLEVTVSKKTKK